MLKVGEIDIVQQSLNNEFQIERLTRIIELLMFKTSVHINKEELSKIDNDALKTLQLRYPNSGINIITSKEVKNAADK